MKEGDYIMKLTEMIELANNGIKAKDVLTLHKQGFTKDIILELSQEPAKETEPETESEPETPSPATPTEPAPEPEGKSDNPAILEIEKLKAQLEAERSKVAALQKNNRQRNNDTLEREDPNKNIMDYISSIM